MRRAVCLLALLCSCFAVPRASAAGWAALAPMPDQRAEVSAAAIGTRIYVAGGFASGVTGTALGSARIDAFDTATGRWERVPDLPLPVHHTALVAVGSRLVVLGGYVSLFVPYVSTWVLETDAVVPAWQPFVPLPEPRGAHAAVSDGERIWIAGGAYGLAGVHETAYVLVPGATSWRPIAALPQPREHLAAAFMDGRIYVAGGRRLSVESNTGRLDVYDPVTDTWTQGPDMPTPRGGIAGAVLGGRFYVFGGETSGDRTFSEAEAFDPSIGAWTSMPPMPTSRHGLGAATSGGGIHVIAGGRVAGLSLSDVHERLEP